MLTDEERAKMHAWIGQIRKAVWSINGRMGTIQGRSLFNQEPTIQEVETLLDVAQQMEAFCINAEE